MAIIALDVGTERVGVAISHSLLFVEEYGVLSPQPVDQFMMRLRALIEAEGVERIVVGLPQPKGRQKVQAERIQALAQLIGQQVRVPIVFEDEAFTSSMAEELLADAGVEKKAQVGAVDQLSAKLILEQYLSRSADQR